MDLSITSYVAALAVVSLIAFLWTNRRFGMRPKGYPPGPPTIPFLGNLHQMPMTNIHYKFQELAKEYGPIVSLKLGGQTTILLNSDEVVRDLCDKRGGIYSARMDVFIRQFGDDLNILLKSNDDTWRRLRKMYHLRLNSRVADNYLPYQDFETIQLLHGLLQSPGGFEHHIKRSTTSLGSTIIYGWRTTSTDLPAVKEMFQWVDGYAVLAGSVQITDWFPFLRPIYRRLPSSISSFMKEMNRLNDIERNLWFSLLNDAKSKIEKGNMNPSFCRDQLISTDKDKLTDREIAFNSGHGWAGASDTTYNTLMGFVKAMMLYPEAQLTAKVEIDKVVGPDKLPEWKDLNDLPYIRCILKETLRWMPTTLLGGMPHAASQDDNYMGYTIPKGAGIIINVWTINNDEKRAEDPRTFNPDRYKGDLNGIGKSASKQPSERDNYTFGAGRRICPGIHVAERGLFLAMSRILWAFDIERSLDENGNPFPVDQDAMTAGLVAAPVPFKCNIRPRSQMKQKSITELFAQSQDSLDDEGNYTQEFLDKAFAKADLH